MDHQHYWKEWISDKTGALLKCKICEELSFLPPEEIEKFRQLIESGVECDEIDVVPNQIFIMNETESLN